MKLKELIDVLNNYDSHTAQYRDLEVVVAIHSPSVGPSASVDVTGCHVGIDWDNGKLFLTTKDPIVKKTNKETAFDTAHELLMYLATKPVKKKSYEVDMAQKCLKEAGYTDEDFEKYRKFFHKE